MGKDIKISFRLKVGRDDDLISWFESISANDKSYYIREALRGSLKGIPQASLPSVNSIRNHNEDSAGKNMIKPADKLKPISEISEAELEKNLKGWMD